MTDFICILCLNHNESSINVSGEDGIRLEIPSILHKYFQPFFEVLPDTGHLCRKCWWKLEMFHEFYLEIEAIRNATFQNTIFLDCDKESPLTIKEEPITDDETDCCRMSESINFGLNVFNQNSQPPTNDDSLLQSIDKAEVNTPSNITYTRSCTRNQSFSDSKKKKPLTWSFKRKFENRQEKDNYFVKEKIWSVYGTTTNSVGLKVNYKCNLVPKKYGVCGARLYTFKKHQSDVYQLYQAGVHTHKYHKSESDNLRDQIIELYRNGNKPIEIEATLNRNSADTIVTRKKIYNILYYHTRCETDNSFILNNAEAAPNFRA